jgi:hypothetical protein
MRPLTCIFIHIVFWYQKMENNDDEGARDEAEEDDLHAEILEGAEQEEFHLHPQILEMFDHHVQHLKDSRVKRKRELVLKPVVPVAFEGALTVAEDVTGEAAASSGQHNNYVAVLDADGEVDLAASVAFGPGDEYDGDLVLRRLNLLLERIDQRGYQRSRQQVRFHDAFIRATSRVAFRQDWASSRPSIMRKYNWDKAPSEILISTPRRFGKTFS